MKALIKKAILSLSHFKAVREFYRGKGAILMLHRIAPIDKNRIQANENMKVSPEFLDHFIAESKRQGWHFISLDELHDGLISGNLAQNFLCITIDDGYKDNLTYGLSVFEKHGVPFCVYVCTSFPESSHNMWWFGLEDFLLNKDSFALDSRLKESNNGGGGSS